MGTIQIEVLIRIFKSRFNLNATFGRPSVIYKKTPSKAGEGFVEYTMPKPCWKILKFKIEPVISKGTFTVEANIPVSTSLDYPVRLGSTVPALLYPGNGRCGSR